VDKESVVARANFDLVGLFGFAEGKVHINSVGKVEFVQKLNVGGNLSLVNGVCSAVTKPKYHLLFIHTYLYMIDNLLLLALFGTLSV
jgi:hypothetical protein